jgi:hypothetical protein
MCFDVAAIRPGRPVPRTAHRRLRKLLERAVIGDADRRAFEQATSTPH